MTRKAMTRKLLLPAAIAVLLSSVSLYAFFSSALAYPQNLSLLAAAAPFVAWIAFSFFTSRICTADFCPTLVRDSASFLPFMLLFLAPLSSSFSGLSTAAWGGFDTAGLAANLFLKLLLALSLTGFVAVKALLLPQPFVAIASRLPRVKPSTVLIAMCVAYFIVLFSMSVLRFLTFKTPPPDLWIFNQAMWNTLHGNFMITTRTLELGNQVLLGDHFFLILLAILPFYALFQHPLSLYFIESALIAVSAVPLYWIAKSALKSERAALVFAAAFFLFPALQFVHLSEFQPVAFTIPFLLFAFHYLMQNRLRLFGLFTALALSVRETQAPVVFMFGLYIALALRRYKLGAVVCASAVAWLLLAVFVFIPALGPPYQYIGGTQNAFANLGNTPQEIVSNVLSNPLILVNEATTAQDLGYLALLFLPVIFLPLLSPAILIPASVFAINLLSGRAPAATIYFQYNAELIAFLFIAAVLGAKRLIPILARRFPNANPRAAVIATLLAASLFSSVLFGPTPLSLLDPAPNAASFNPQEYVVTQHHIALLGAVASIPQSASVSSDSLIAAHLSSRRQLDYFPEALGTSDYVLIDTSFPDNESNLYPQKIEELRNSAEFERLVDSDGILLLRRAKT